MTPSPVLRLTPVRGTQYASHTKERQRCAVLRCRKTNV
jgi:hypothetical protein